MSQINLRIRGALAALALAFSLSAFAQTAPANLKISASVSAAHVGENPLRLTLTDAAGKPLVGAKVTLSVGMTNMDMGTSHPEVVEEGDGVYRATVSFAMAGPWRVTVKVGETTQSFDFQVGAGGKSMDGMMGRLGPWPMGKEGSGTSWLPESSPMFMKGLPKAGRYDLSLMGFFTLNYSDAGGKRGDDRFYSNSMPMLMARRETGGGTLGMNLMVSLDPIFNGEFGYPDLFQTGETAHGIKLVDYQHPHDLLSELTVSYSHPVGKGMNAFVYGGPVGEPALGGPTFAHRPSGMEIPEAPISHHWFDSTHISWGVVTAGVNSEKWQLEGSLFNGHEPNENRYAPDPISLNSASTRLTYNPSRNLSFNVSYGYLHSPESTEPGVDQHRLTAAGIWSHPLPSGDNLSVSAVYGRNMVRGENSDAFVLEGTYYRGADSFFARWENVDKNELVGVPAGSYKVNKVLFGGIKNLTSQRGFDVGLGAYAGVYAFPSSLDPFYGKNPVTLGIFLRVRPSRMTH